MRRCKTPRLLRSSRGRSCFRLRRVESCLPIIYRASNGELKLSREAYSGIFLGKITRWNDPRIVVTNPGHKASADGDSNRKQNGL